MKSSSFAKAITLGCLVLVAVPVACGDDTSNGSTKSANAGAGGDQNPDHVGGAGGADHAGGAGGAALPPGLSEAPTTVDCGMSCTSAKVGALGQVVYVDPCCAGAAKDACGLTTTFLAQTGLSFGESCLAKNQPGDADDSCPSPTPAMVPVMGTTATLDAFPGCCRAATGTCGVLVNKVTLGQGLVPLGDLGLGCVDSAPFFPGVAAKACGAGAGGAGGAGGATGGGAGGVGGVGGLMTGGAGANQ